MLRFFLSRLKLVPVPIYKIVGHFIKGALHSIKKQLMWATPTMEWIYRCHNYILHLSPKYSKYRLYSGARLILIANLRTEQVSGS